MTWVGRLAGTTCEQLGSLIDLGPTILEMTGCGEMSRAQGRSLVPLLKNLRIYDKIKPTRLDPMYKAFYDGFSMVVPADAEEYRDMLIKKFPHEEEGIDGFYAAIGHLLTVMDAHSLITNGEYVSGVWKIISNPRAMVTVISCANLTMGEFLDKFFTDKALLSVMASYTGMLGDGPENS